MPVLAFDLFCPILGACLKRLFLQSTAPEETKRTSYPFFFNSEICATRFAIRFSSGNPDESVSTLEPILTKILFDKLMTLRDSTFHKNTNLTCNEEAIFLKQKKRCLKKNFFRPASIFILENFIPLDFLLNRKVRIFQCLHYNPKHSVWYQFFHCLN